MSIGLFVLLLCLGSLCEKDSFSYRLYYKSSDIVLNLDNQDSGIGRDVYIYIIYKQQPFQVKVAEVQYNTIQKKHDRIWALNPEPLPCQGSTFPTELMGPY